MHDISDTRKGKKMYKLVVSLGVFLLAAKGATAAIDCQVPPSCEELGYKDNVGVCPNEYIACPFDRMKGKCILDAKPGQIAYFTSAPGAGWLMCNGSVYNKDTYPDLYKVLGTRFCNSYHGGTCTTNYFRVPQYSGYFLRVYGAPSSTYGGSANYSLTTPQKEQLPNITAGGGMWEANSNTSFSGAFYRSSGTGYWGTNGGLDADNYSMMFDASRSNSIYTSGGHVIPANIGVYAYIFAGRYGTSYELGSCSKGMFYNQDAKACSSSKYTNYLYISQSGSSAKVLDTYNVDYGYSDTIAEAKSTVSAYCSASKTPSNSDLNGMDVLIGYVPYNCIATSDGVYDANEMRAITSDTDYEDTCYSEYTIMCTQNL